MSPKKDAVGTNGLPLELVLLLLCNAVGAKEEQEQKVFSTYTCTKTHRNFTHTQLWSVRKIIADYPAKLAAVCVWVENGVKNKNKKRVRKERKKKKVQRPNWRILLSL